VSEELEQESVVAGVFEQGGELLGFEDRRLLRCPVRFLGGFELGDRICGEPAAADGEAADLTERYQGDDGSGGGERALVRRRPARDAVDAELAQLDRGERPLVRVGRA
jgi:hypothetical protein